MLTVECRMSNVERGNCTLRSPSVSHSEFPGGRIRPAARAPDRPPQRRRTLRAGWRGRRALAAAAGSRSPATLRFARYPHANAAGLGTPTDNSDRPLTASGNAAIEAREAIARCGGLGSARFALGSAHGRRGERPAPGHAGTATAAGRGLARRAEEAARAGDPERERSEPCAAGCRCAGGRFSSAAPPPVGRWSYVGVLIGKPCPPRGSAGHRVGASVPGRPHAGPRRESPTGHSTERRIPGAGAGLSPPRPGRARRQPFASLGTLTLTQRASYADRQLRQTAHRLGQRGDRSSRSHSPLRRTRLRSGCARLGSRPPRRGPGSRAHPCRHGGRSGARAAGRGGRPRHGSGTRAERVLRGGLPLRGRRWSADFVLIGGDPMHPAWLLAGGGPLPPRRSSLCRWSVRGGVDRRTLPAARIGRASSRSERSRAAACRPAARGPDRPQHGTPHPGRGSRALAAAAGSRSPATLRFARYPHANAAGLVTPTDNSDRPLTASGNAATEAREAIARCGGLGSARVALGSAHGRRGEGPAPERTRAATVAGRGLARRAVEAARFRDPERERSEPCAVAVSVAIFRGCFRRCFLGHSVDIPWPFPPVPGPPR